MIKFDDHIIMDYRNEDDYKALTEAVDDDIKAIVVMVDDKWLDDDRDFRFREEGEDFADVKTPIIEKIQKAVDDTWTEDEGILFMNIPALVVAADTLMSYKQEMLEDLREILTGTVE
jgi:hypothetical protein